MEDFFTLKNIISKGIINGYMSLKLGDIDMVNGRWILSDDKDIGSTWDIILNPEFAKAFWGEDYENHLTKIVVMSSNDRIEYLRNFEEDVDIQKEIKNNEPEFTVTDAIMELIQISLKRIKEHSMDLYVESCEDTYKSLKPILDKTSVTELKEIDFLIMNSSDRVMMNNLSKYLNDIGKLPFTLCPECGCDDFKHAEGCSIFRRSEDYLISQNDGC